MDCGWSKETDGRMGFGWYTGKYCTPYNVELDSGEWDDDAVRVIKQMKHCDGDMDVAAAMRAIAQNRRKAQQQAANRKAQAEAQRQAQLRQQKLWEAQEEENRRQERLRQQELERLRNERERQRQEQERIQKAQEEAERKARKPATTRSMTSW